MPTAMKPPFRRPGTAVGATARRSATALAVAGLIAGAGAASAAAQTVNVYNWSDYIAEDTNANFQAETGITVNYDVFDGNEVLEAKLLAGNTGYDVVVPTSSFMERQIKAGLFMPLDRSKLPNWSNLDPDTMALLTQYDPGNTHGVPYMMGTTGFGYTVGDIQERMADAPVDSLDMLFNPEIVARFADCGVTLLDSPTEVYDLTLVYLGLPVDSEDPEHLAQVEAVWEAIRPHIRYFNSSQYINDLANGDICVAMGYSGDVLQARDRAAEAGNGVEVRYTIPREGTLLAFDMLAIPADAPNPDNAHAYINYMLRPEVAAAITNHVNYANLNTAATALVDEAIRTDPAIYPAAEVRAKMRLQTARSQRFDRLLARAWTRLKSGT